MSGAHTVVMTNYHRIGRIDSHNPLHRLHTVDTDVFSSQVDYMQKHGKIVSLDDVRHCRDLADINYVISVDDVPAAAVEGIELLLQRQLPVTVSVCAHLATHGWGTRDKVYCIEKYADPDEVASAVRAVLPHHATGTDQVSIYHLTKRDDLDPDMVSAALIDPLFAQVEDQARPYLGGDAYLSWHTIRCRLASRPLVTLANHGFSHANLAAMSRTRLEDDITRSHHAFAQHLGHKPRYFTIPFGRYHQRLAIDCVDILHRLGYHGILWVGDVANLVRAPYESQLLQLTRLHTPTTLDGFAASIRNLASNRLESAVWQLRPLAHHKPVTIIESSDPQRSIQHEMVVRQGKDYASSPEFYRYQFTANPAKGDRPDFYAAECDGRIEATAYNFHTTFRIGDVTVPGVYLSSWRKLPEAHRIAAGMLVKKMTAREAVVGVYHPSPRAAAAFQTWHRVPVWHLTIPVDDTKPTGTLQRMVELDQFDDALTPLCAALMGEAGFTVVRDRSYYKWRHESYSLAACRYVLLRHRDLPVAYAVTLRRGARISVADWYASSRVDYAELIAAVLWFAHARKAQTVEMETSSSALADDILARFAATRTGFDNYYHLNSTKLTDLGVPDAHQRWQDFRFHETATTGDVLIR